MIKVQLKNGSFRSVPEQTAQMLVKSHGATIVDKGFKGTKEVPIELQKTPLITELPQFAKQIEALRAENDKLTTVNKKLSQDIIDLMNEIEKLKENGKTIQVDAKEAKSRKATIDPNS